MPIDRSAKVHPRAELDGSVTVGANSVIDEHARIGPNCFIGNNVTVTGYTEIGADTQVYHNAVIGTPPQDLKYTGEPTRLVIGAENVIREGVTINTGTEAGGSVTIIGSRNFLMACSHVAHDCVLGDEIVMANGVLLAGHVKVEDHVVFSGAAAVHHFASIGKFAFVGGLTRIVQDVPPFMMVDGARSLPRRVNVIGLRRNGMSDERIAAIEHAFRVIYRAKLSRKQAFDRLEKEGRTTEDVQYLIDFLRRTEKGKKGRYLEGFRRSH